MENMKGIAFREYEHGFTQIQNTKYANQNMIALQVSQASCVTFASAIPVTRVSDMSGGRGDLIKNKLPPPSRRRFWLW